MTKICRDNQIEKIDTIINAIHILDDLYKYKNKDQVFDLLTQIQQVVITICTVIEQELCVYDTFIKDSEELCEILFQISESFDDYERFCLLINNVELKMHNLKQSLCTMVPRKEVVFLPYQVCMWDSLESVWIASNEDMETDSYVVAIPYYDVMSDGTLGDLHDQRDEYPDNVLVTPYDQYLLEERHPDVIFFHNPYDDCNLITRVPERYYASHLKKCTEQLVYIPYFISPEGGPSDHQCYLPGVLFADKVIVQPGSIYETYCRVYSRVRKENGWEQLLKPAEEKFLPLSSPKFDKVLNRNYKIGDLPESWQKVIVKSDGKRKKIVLFNVTIASILHNNERELEKIDRILKVFKQWSDEVVLLWRPHPLLLSAINSMREQLRDEYIMRVEKFKEEQWGIYDDTPDANLAIVVSDLYYGDWSSLEVAYRATGKPIVVKSIIEEEENDILYEVRKQNENQTMRIDNKCVKDNEQNAIGKNIYRTFIV